MVNVEAANWPSQHLIGNSVGLLDASLVPNGTISSTMDIAGPQPAPAVGLRYVPGAHPIKPNILCNQSKVGFSHRRNNTI